MSGLNAIKHSLLVIPYVMSHQLCINLLWCNNEKPATHYQILLHITEDTRVDLLMQTKKRQNSRSSNISSDNRC